MRLFINPESLSFQEPKVSSYLFLLLQFLSSSFFLQFLEFKMGYSFLLNTKVSLATFRKKFDIPNDVEVAYYHESEIALHRGANTLFFPLMAILEGKVRFPVDPPLLNTLRYYGLYPD